MDGDRFDAMTRSLATGGSRRMVLRAFAGAIGASFAGVGTALGAPRCKRVNQACQTTADCCPGLNANGNVYCASNGKKSKVCQACPVETPTACNGGCVDTSDDNNNCGACGERCFGGSSCVNGACQCPQGQVFDGSGQCVCGAAPCDADEECCDQFHCKFGTCSPCLAAGEVDNGIEQCCSGAAQGSSDGTVCVNFCDTDADCQPNTGQECMPISGSNNGVCGCQSGAMITEGGNCVCEGTNCQGGAPCCEDYVCFLGQCQQCGTTGQDCHDFLGNPGDFLCCSGTCDPSTVTCT